MRTILICVIISATTFLHGICSAQEQGGAGGGSKIEGASTSKQASLQVNTMNSSQPSPLTIEPGDSEPNTNEGIYFWLDANETWQLRWQGEPGILVWVRLMAENPIDDVMTVGDGIKPETNGKRVLMLTGTTNSEMAGISFKCKAPLMTIDAKWNMVRDKSKLTIAGQSIVSNRLPVDIVPSIYKDILASSDGTANEMRIKSAEPEISGGHSTGHGAGPSK